MPSREVVENFVRMVESGKFVDAMETYYAPDATAQENNESPRVGLSALIANEHRVLAAFDRVEARCLEPPMIDGDNVAIHWEFVFRDKSGRILRLDELAQQRWRDEKIAAERFFYDSRQLRP